MLDKQSDLVAYAAVLIFHEELKLYLSLKTLDACDAQRRLRLAGLVYCLDFEKLPQKLLTSWEDHPSPQSSKPQFYYDCGNTCQLENLVSWPDGHF